MKVPSTVSLIGRLIQITYYSSSELGSSVVNYDRHDSGFIVACNIQKNVLFFFENRIQTDSRKPLKSNIKHYSLPTDNIKKFGELDSIIYVTNVLEDLECTYRHVFKNSPDFFCDDPIKMNVMAARHSKGKIFNKTGIIG
jgi:hypothetical protein